MDKTTFQHHLQKEKYITKNDQKNNLQPLAAQLNIGKVLNMMKINEDIKVKIILNTRCVTQTEYLYLCHAFDTLSVYLKTMNSCTDTALSLPSST